MLGVRSSTELVLYSGPPWLQSGAITRSSGRSAGGKICFQPHLVAGAGFMSLQPCDGEPWLPRTGQSLTPVLDGSVTSQHLCCVLWVGGKSQVLPTLRGKGFTGVCVNIRGQEITGLSSDPTWPPTASSPQAPSVSARTGVLFSGAQGGPSVLLPLLG